MRQVVAVAWYRFRTTLARRFGGLVALVLLTGLLGGLAMGGIAGARRTQSSFPAYLTRTNAFNAGVMTAIYSPPLGNTPYDPGLVAKIARLPHVRQVADFTVVNPNFTALAPVHGQMLPGEAPPTIGGSLDGAFSKVGRVTVTQGRVPDPNRMDEVFLSSGAARESGLHVGSALPVGFFTNAQLALPNCCSANGTGALAPHLELTLKVVGIGVVQPTELIEDDVDRLSDSYVLLTPALMKRLIPCCAYVTQTAIRVDGGNRNAPAVLGEIARLRPSSKVFRSNGGLSVAIGEAKAERAVEPESIALAAFGAIVALAAFLIIGQLIGRELRAGGDDRTALRALGATRAMTAADGLVGTLLSVFVGALLAGAVAVAMSPWTLLGPVRPVTPRRLTVDWTVLATGVAALVVVLSAIAIWIAYRQARNVAPNRRGRRHASRAGRAAADAGLPAPAVTGIRFAIDPGSGSDAVPARSAIFGAILALLVVTATVTFGASLRTLVSRPSLYGWNWNYELLSGYSGQEDLPQGIVTRLLDHDRDVSAWSGIYFAGASIDGHATPAIGASPNAAVQPPLLSGHGLEARDQVVLGPSTLAALHKHVGDTVSVVLGKTQPTQLRVVGTATMPAIGNSGGHVSMGSGAWLAYDLIPAQLRNLQQSSIPGPQAVLIRTRSSAAPNVALASVRQVDAAINKDDSDMPAGGVSGVLRPAEIVNYRTMGTTPALFGITLAVGATAALMLTLIASVRRRRRDLALLKTLGFTRRQLAAVVAWQSSIAVTIGIVVGVPLGIVIGRTLWNLFAHAINAVPQPTVPATTIAIISVGALVLANVIAAIPALQAAHTRTAVLLHAE